MSLGHIEHFLVLSDDMDGTRDWYVRVLGFRVVFEHGGYAGVALGPAEIHLAEAAPRDGLQYQAGCYLRVASGIDEYIAQIQGTGQALTATLKDHPVYDMREATVRDPDGNDLYIGQPLAASTARPPVPAEP